MDFFILNNEEKLSYGKALYELLEASDVEFFPPLSSRSSTTQSTLKPSVSAQNGVRAYYNQMIKQNILCAHDSGKIAGLVSYIENYSCDAIGNSELPNIYVSTVIVSPEYRGQKLTARMYSHLFDVIFPDHLVFTRTWSTNFAHTRILSSFGFIEHLRLENDRGVGIDTVYYKKEKSKCLVAFGG